MRRRHFSVLVLAGLVTAGLACLAPEAEAQPSTVTVTEGGFELSCPASGTEGSVLTCTLSNTNDSPKPWPVVALLHSSKDTNRALVRGAMVDAAFGSLSPTVTIDGGVWWIGDRLVGYSRFDWPGSAQSSGTTGDSRTVRISLTDDAAFEGAERFYVGLGPDGSRSVGKLWISRKAVTLQASDAASSDASLGSASVRAGSSVTDLSSSDLSASPVAYSMDVGYESTEASVRVTPAHDRASVTGVTVTHPEAGSSSTVSYDDASGSSAFKLAVGATAVSVVVEAEDGSTEVTHTFTINRAALSGSEITVTQDPFTLSCPARVSEGSFIECTLTNGGMSRTAWPVVGLLHSSLDTDRATVAGDPLTPASGSSYSQDAGFASYQLNPLERFRFGHGELFSGSSRSDRVTYGYEKFDWEGTAAAGESRRIWVETLLNDSDEPMSAGDEILYVALAPNVYRGLRDLVDNKAPVIVADPEKGIASITWTDPVTDSVTVTVRAAGAEAGDSIRFRYRAAGAGEWTGLDSQPASSTASFALSGLAAGATYRVQASLDNDYATRADAFLTTAFASTVSTLAVSSVSDTTATATATVTGTSEGSQVHLRHRSEDASDWIALPPKAAAATVAFDLAGLVEGTRYEVEASTDRHFRAVARQTFTTTPAASVDSVVVQPVSRDKATATVRADTRYSAKPVHVRYKESGAGAWTTLGPRDFSTGDDFPAAIASFTLSGLGAATAYEAEASLDDDFTTSVSTSFTSWQGPSLSVTPEVTGRTTATVTVDVARNRLSDSVHLRYKKTADSNWTTETSQKAYPRVTFKLTGLDEATSYEVQVSLSSGFASATEANFTTFQSMSIGSVTATASGSSVARVAVRFGGDVRGILYMRYKKPTDTDWTSARPQQLKGDDLVTFTLRSLDASTAYDVQVSMESDFSPHVGTAFTTAAQASIATAELLGRGRFGATIGVTVSEPNAETSVHLRYRKSGGSWQEAAAKVSAERLEFPLARLTADTAYEVQASLSSSYASPTVVNFRTAPLQVQSISPVATGYSTGSVTVDTGGYVYNLYVRYKKSGETDWITFPRKVSRSRYSGLALTDLEPDTTYSVEVAAAPSFSSASRRSGRFQTWSHTSISAVSASATGPTTATVTVAVSDPRSGDTVHLRYRKSGETDWTIAAPREAAPTVTFQLTGLDAATLYEVRASLTSNFLTTSSGSFTTGAPVNSSPKFPDSNNDGTADPVMSSVDENAVSVDVGTPVTVTDDDDTLTYSVAEASVTDAADHLRDFKRDFEVVAVAGTGQGESRVLPMVKVKARSDAAIDYEARSSYVVLLEVSDGKDAAGAAEDSPTVDDDVVLTVTVTDVNEPPVFGSDVAPVYVDQISVGGSLSSAGVERFGFRFTTGGTTGDLFSLGRVRALTSVPSGATLAAQIYSSDGSGAGGRGLPGVLVGSLAVPSVLDADAATVEEFDAAGLVLSGATDYWVVFTTTSGAARFVAAAAGSRHVDAASGWALGGSASHDGSGWERSAGEAPWSIALVGAPLRTVAENTAGGTDVGAVVAATDPDQDTLTYTVAATSSTDGPAHVTAFNETFEIDTDGQISVKTDAVIDYETRSSYVVQLQVTDSEDSAGNTETNPTVDDTVVLTLTVTDVDEAGTVTISGTPAAGETLTASLAEGDVVSSTDWAWSSSATQSSGYTPIDGETANTYTVGVADVGRFLRATATYTDSHASGKTLSATTAAVGASNTAPKFADSNNDGTPDPVTRTVAENTAGGTDVGSAVAATDPDEGDTLTYSVAATDDQNTAAVAAKNAFDTNFEIDADGQISIKTGATIDHETRSTYVVTYQVSDGKDAAGAADTTVDDTLTLTVTVTDVDEPGTVTIGGTPAAGETLTASLADGDVVSATAWAWSSSATQSSGYTPIDGETANTYTVGVGDVGRFLRATVTYTDTHGAKSVSATTSAVGASNTDPKFADSDNDGTPDPVTRTVVENSTGDVGSAVAASDPDEGDTLTYSVAATDDQNTAAVAAKNAFDTNFEIDSDGQISIKTGVTIDHETRSVVCGLLPGVRPQGRSRRRRHRHRRHADANRERDRRRRGGHGHDRGHPGSG